MNNMVCFEKYPPGSLGTLFIDLAIDRINDAMPNTIVERENEICVANTESLRDALKILYDKYVEPLKITPVNLTGNDKRTLSKLTGGLIDPGNPGTIIKLVMEFLDKGGINHLGKTDITPSMMRIEFYEYGRPGYIHRITAKHKEHIYKRTNLLNIAFFILGAYIAFLAKYAAQKRIKYYVPLPGSPGTLMDDVRKKLRMIYMWEEPPRQVVAYIVGEILAQHRGITIDTVGHIIDIMYSANRSSLLRIDGLSSDGLAVVLRKMSEGARIVSKLLQPIIQYYSLKPASRTKMYKDKEKKIINVLIDILFHLLFNLYRYAQGSDESLYMIIRDTKILEETIRQANNVKEVASMYGVGDREALLEIIRGARTAFTKLSI